MTGSPLVLDRAELHGSLQDPVLGSVTFLNEIMARYPEAISFAPGAPNLGYLDELDVSRQVDRFLTHLRQDRGLDEQQARRQLYEYGPSRGLINHLVAEFLRTDLRITVPESAVVITVGAQEAMLLVLRALCRPGRDVLGVVDPSFVGVIGAARLLDVDLVPVEEDGDSLDFARLAQACRAARAQGRRLRALYVAPDHANPTGTVLGPTARQQLLELAEQEDFLLIEDTAYHFTAEPGVELPSLKALDRNTRVIQLGTFAKICLPGARVGYVVADQPVHGADGRPRRLADELAELKTMVTVNTSPISQAVVGGMLLEHGGSLTALGRPKAELYRHNLALLLKALDQHLGPDLPPGLHWNRPTGGFFVRLTLPVLADAALLEISASRYGVLWTPMAQFHVGGGGTHQLRLSCSYLDSKQIELGAARLAAFLRDLAL
ncbi:aminotransferase-like domain-containing protein [Streptomyces swartbergensis]|uniref:aminotransferase-like domain-containing protein n=1 Tax=Streptomyces swartbergensis TaxID=487165 RepID=UPI0038242C30